MYMYCRDDVCFPDNFYIVKNPDTVHMYMYKKETQKFAVKNPEPCMKIKENRNLLETLQLLTFYISWHFPWSSVFITCIFSIDGIKRVDLQVHFL